MNKLAFHIGYLEKKAIDIKGVRKASKLLRRSGDWIRRAPFINENTNLTGFTKKILSSNKEPLISIGAITSQNIPSVLRKKMPKMPNVPPGKIISRGDILNIPAVNFFNPDAKIPINREMINRLSVMHEGLERKQVLSKPFQLWHGHRGPEVVIQESNMIASLPKKYKAVKDFFTHMRNIDSSRPMLEKVLPGFKYGKTRVSNKAALKMGGIVSKKLPEEVMTEKSLKKLLGV